ncbi:hypothetical protein KIN20_027829 [Parelaphostrongylus tenuis]|uniref:Uncharacterized protein n=1 Tax=Parelaphostrongylus tenuis TaxID=148309 RepID=A0AAD5R031_PARTN|nr:hypothetical protein KIN20_027829 [Parelaphostrongylus tenuis]
MDNAEDNKAINANFYGEQLRMLALSVREKSAKPVNVELFQDRAHAHSVKSTRHILKKTGLDHGTTPTA